MNQRSQKLPRSRRPALRHVLAMLLAGLQLAGCSGANFPPGHGDGGTPRNELNLYPGVLQKFCPPGQATKAKC